MRQEQNKREKTEKQLPVRTLNLTCWRERPQFGNSFRLKKGGGCSSRLRVKVQALFATLTPPAARAVGLHFGEARVSILRS